jgi:hypothetical protein
MLNVEALMKTAPESCGLTDFGGDEIHPALAKVVKLLQALQPFPGTQSRADTATLLGEWTRHCLLENLRISSELPSISLISYMERFFGRAHADG